MTPDVAILCWDSVASPFRKKAIIQISLAIGVPFFVLLIFLALYGGKEAKYAVILILLVFIIGIVIDFVLFRKKYVRFLVYDDYIKCVDLPRSVNVAETVRYATIVTGVLTKDPGNIGTGLLMQSQECFKIKWKSVSSVEIGSDFLNICCKGDEMYVPCTDEIHSKMVEIVKEKVSGSKIVILSSENER